MAKNKSTHTFTSYAEVASKQFVKNGQKRTAKSFNSTLRRLNSFFGKEVIDLKDINSASMKRFQSYLKEDGLMLNTVSYYLRNTRSLYNKAAKDGLISKKKGDPFEGLFTGNAPTKKRALTKKQMTQLSCKETLFLSRSTKANKEIYAGLLYFLFCFHGRGISFVDLCYLRKNNVRGREIRYIRKKTGKELVIRITKQMQKILEYFADKVENSPYLFPILDANKENLYKQYENALHKQNRILKIIGKTIGLREPLSTHWARHSWATIAQHKGASVGMISQALGHGDEKTTAIYLNSFNASALHKLSEDISNSIGLSMNR